MSTPIPPAPPIGSSYDELVVLARVNRAAAVAKRSAQVEATCRILIEELGDEKAIGLARHVSDDEGALLTRLGLFWQNTTVEKLQGSKCDCDYTETCGNHDKHSAYVSWFPIDE